MRTALLAHSREPTSFCHLRIDMVEPIANTAQYFASRRLGGNQFQRAVQLSALRCILNAALIGRQLRRSAITSRLSRTNDLTAAVVERDRLHPYGQAFGLIW